MVGPADLGGLSRAFALGIERGFPEVLSRGIVQVCSLVEDIEAAVKQTSSAVGIGPITVGVPPSVWTYRGRPGPDIRIKAAFIPWGRMHIEYIQWLGGNCIYKEHLERKGYGLHHVGICSHDLDADIDTFKRIGIEVVQLGRNPETGGGVAYMDTEDLLGVIVELIPPLEKIAALQPFLHLLK